MPNFKQFYQGDTPAFRFEFKAKDGSALPEGIAAVFVIASKCGTKVFRNENLLDEFGKADFRIPKTVSDALKPGEYRWGVSLKYNAANADNADWQTPEGNGVLFVEANAAFPGADGASNVPIGGVFDDIVYEVNAYQVTGGGTSNYNELTGKPRINSVELSGNKTAAELGLADAQSLENKANKIPVANQWKYTIESIEDVPVADGDVFQVITGDADIPTLELTEATLDGTTFQWFVSPEIGISALNLQNVTATKTDGTDSLTVSIISKQVYKDLSDVETEVLQEINSESYSRSAADDQLGNRFAAYRTATAQDIIDSQKLGKADIVDPINNPNGWMFLWASVTGNSVGVQIVAMGYSPVLNQFQQTSLSIQVASEEVAGVVLPDVIRQVNQNRDDILNLQQTGRLPLDIPTRAALNAYDTTNTPIGQDTTVLADEEQSGSLTKWVYDPNYDTTLYPNAVIVNGFRFRFIGQEVPYTIATATTAGLVLSTATSTPGKINVETDGTMSVWGWDAISDAVSDLQLFAQSQNMYNNNHNHSGSANGVKIDWSNIANIPPDTAEVNEATGKIVSQANPGKAILYYENPPTKS